MQQNDKAPLNEKDVAQNSDNKIDQDFPGFPDGESKEKLINPETKDEKKVAQVDVKDGEKINKDEDADETDELQSDGSGGAFEATENMRDDD